MDTDLGRRIQSANRTAMQWESDPDLQADIRASIPFEDLVPELVGAAETLWRPYLNAADGGNATESAGRSDVVQCETSCFRDDDADWEGDDLLLKRLTLYFKQEVMTWCNQPPCSNPNCTGNEDGKQMTSQGVRGPETEEEKAGRASRVDVYKCNLCGTETTFPRYNSTRALFESRRGRCGEFANLFGAYCRALGFDARYVLDLTDHVWVEAWSVRQQRWLMADSCEGLIDCPNMYEQGWGKKLNYAIGATHDSVADVSKRYTRKFYSDDFQARRREYAPDENTSDRIFAHIDGAIKRKKVLVKGRVDELEKRSKAEEKFFGMVQSSSVWDVEYKEGRISGSLAWKAARHEVGDGTEKKEGDDSKENGQDDTQSFLIESFYPSSHRNDLTVVVKPPPPSSVPSTAPKMHPECITVGGVPCATTMMNGVSAVVIDEASGCILQSKAFSNWSSAGSFLDTVPNGRIIAICCIKEEKQDSDTNDNSNDNIISSETFSRLGAFDIDAATATSGFFGFVGQLNYHPKWATSLETVDNKQSIKVSLQLDESSLPETKLRTEANTTPAVVSTRLPESIMPLKTQLEASTYQKRVAFNAFMGSESTDISCIGYVTRPGAPIYLIDNQSFPFRRADGHSHNSIADNNESWVTYHMLPDPLVPDDDEVKEDSKAASNSDDAAPKFDVPVADDHFHGLLGNQLLTKNGTSNPTLMDTSSALANTRLVALYFSAHWCGPCRGFTPLLIEFYNHLKEVAPTHGLEIIFVSSDRNEGEFQQYYGTMPFQALPFANRSMAQQMKSVFGVRGIPSLVLIDSISGQIVTSPDETRRDVHQACQRGEEAIERLFQTWLDKVPFESKSMLEIMALSSQEAEAGAKSRMDDAATSNTKAQSYLQRKKDSADCKQGEKAKSKVLPSTEESAALIKEIFTQLVAKGMKPNEAAVAAIKQATNGHNNISVPTKFEEGVLQGTSERCVTEMKNETIEAIAEKMCQLNAGDKTKVANVLSTAKKYVANVQKNPSNPRFRNFRLSNKVFDRITSTPGSIGLLKSLGFVIFHSDADFVASIPLSVDLTMMGSVFDNLLKLYTC